VASANATIFRVAPSALSTGAENRGFNCTVDTAHGVFQISFRFGTTCGYNGNTNNVAQNAYVRSFCHPGSRRRPGKIQSPHRRGLWTGWGTCHRSDNTKPLSWVCCTIAPTTPSIPSNFGKCPRNEGARRGMGKAFERLRNIYQATRGSCTVTRTLCLYSFSCHTGISTRVLGTRALRWKQTGHMLAVSSGRVMVESNPRTVSGYRLTRGRTLGERRRRGPQDRPGTDPSAWWCPCSSGGWGVRPYPLRFPGCTAAFRTHIKSRMGVKLRTICQPHRRSAIEFAHFARSFSGNICFHTAW